MDIEEVLQKIRLYRKLNEQTRSFRHKDYNNFYIFYSILDLDSVQDILSEYEQIKVSDIINPKNEFFKFYETNYANKYLVERTETGLKIHFEFSDILFYELLNFFKKDIKKFIELIPNEFSFYSQGNNSYQIPYKVYQDFFTRLQDEGIKEAIKFLTTTSTFTIVSDYEHISTNIKVGCINDYLNYLKKYNY